MKRILIALVATICLTSFTLCLRAADEQTIKGEAMCTKCALHETAKCGCAIKLSDGSLVYAENNDICKDFHENICKANVKVTCTGMITEKDGKKSIALSKIDADKAPANP